jgi:hypothetical protein
MTFDAFIASLHLQEPPMELCEELKALWYDSKGDWERAHEIAQYKNSPIHCLIHAYLHRKEGDEWNAGYWYSRAGRSKFKGSLEQEWEEMALELLGGKIGPC